MNPSQLPRREFLAATAGSLAAFPVTTYALNHSQFQRQSKTSGATAVKGTFPIKAISSHNGLEATKRAYELMKTGTETLDAAIAGVTIVEDDPNDTSVGYGGLPNENGVVELDAAVMHGPTHRAGSVAALQNIKNAAQVAQKVMNYSDHVLLIGEGALQFAKAHGFKEQEMLTDKARKIWLYWKQTISKRDDWLPPSEDEIDPDVAKFFKINVKPNKKKTSSRSKTEVKTSSRSKKFKRPTGTIHCGVMNSRGDISCTTTTSGLAFKIPGRVGDSPIIGAGLYVDNEIGSCGSTGRGEANLQNLCCFAGVELMRNGLSPEEAGMEVLRRVAKHTEDRLRDDKGRPDFGLNFYLLAKDGTHAGVSMWGPADFSITDKKGTRLEQCVALYQK
jgi:N4-(beta-N-acetylglucosaminyl)-L-asparaginase